MHWQNLIGYLLTHQNRVQLKNLVNQLKISNPYDTLLNILYSVNTDLTKQEYIQLVAGKVTSDTLMMVKDVPENVSRTVALEALKLIEAEDKMDKIVKVIKANGEIPDKLSKIKKISEQKMIRPVAQSKSIYKFDTADVVDLLNICDYPCSKEELITLVTYSGRGKTTIMLSLLRLAAESGMKCLYITINDWSETLLKNRIYRANNFPDFQAVCYSECDIHRIESEIDAVQPDFVAVDYLDVITGDNPFDAYRHQLREITQHLKRIAKNHNVLMVTGKQANADDEEITESHLAEAKQGVIANSDLVLGFGKHPTYENTLVCNTIKVRRHKRYTDLLELKIDYSNFILD